MPPSILIVDNDPVRRRRLQESLRDLGYDAVAAEGGEAALQKAANPAAEQPMILHSAPSRPEARSPSTIHALDADGELRPFAEVEADVIRFALAHHRGRMALVARKLGIGRSTLYRKLKELNLAETSGIAAQ